MNPKNNDFDKTIMFSIHEEDHDAQRKELLRKVYEALSEKGYNAIGQITEYILTEEPTYITAHKNARGMVRRIDPRELVAAMLKEYLDL